MTSRRQNTPDLRKHSFDSGTMNCVIVSSKYIDSISVLYLSCFICYHHHHDVRLARISLTLSLHVSLSFIAFGRSSGLHPVSSHSCCMNVRAGRPAFYWPYAGVHRSTSLTISSFVSPAVSGMSGSSSLHSFRDRW